MKQMYSANKYDESHDILKDVNNDNGKLLGHSPVDRSSQGRSSLDRLSQVRSSQESICQDRLC